MTVRWYNPETKKMEDYKPKPPPESPFYIMPMFQEYRAIGVDNRIVKSRSEHKSMLKEHGLEELGNETPKYWDEKKREAAERGEDV